MDLHDDRALVEQWLETWLHVRDIKRSELDGWPVVHVGSATRETEIVCVDPGVDEFSALSRHVAGDPRAMLTVVARDVGPYLVARRHDGVRVDRDDEALMTTTFSHIDVPPLDDGFVVRWDISGHRFAYVVEAGDRVAAEGTVGVLGDVATFDNVETTPDFQRLGLGRHVMATLTAQAMSRGATTGVLAASAPGRQLYTSLGWHVRLEMLSLMGA
jgi:GNAT superfamily N-acetyltransferase